MTYWIVFLLSVVILLKFSRKDYDKSWFCKIFVFIIFFLGVFRDTTIGTDIRLSGGGDYYSIWKTPFSSIQSDRLEVGFLYLTSLFKSIYNSYYFYYGAIYAITIGLYFWAAKRMKINPAVFFAIFFMSSTIIACYNIIRQTLALSAGMLAYSIILYGIDNNNGFKKSSSLFRRVAIYEILIVLLSFGIHTSVVILGVVPLFNIKTIKAMLSKEIVLWGLLAFVVIINYAFSEVIQSYFLLFQSFFNLGERQEFWAEVIEKYGDNISSSHGIMSSLLVGSLAILASRGRRNNLFFIGYVGLLLTQLASVNLGTLGRLFSNLSLFLIYFYAQIFGDLLTEYKIFGTDFRKLIVLLLILFWLSSFYFTTILNESISPYQTYLF